MEVRVFLISQLAEIARALQSSTEMARTMKGLRIEDSVESDGL